MTSPSSFHGGEEGDGMLVGDLSDSEDRLDTIVSHSLSLCVCDIGSGGSKGE